MRIRRSRSALALVAALALGTAGIAAGAAPATAAAARPYLATANGIVGVSQPVTISAPGLKNQVVTVTFSNGPVSVTQQTVVGLNGYGALTWTPTTAGTWLVAGAGSLANAVPTTISVAAMPTTTVLETVNQAGAGQTTNLIAFVRANAGQSNVPAGTVTFSYVGGAVLGTAGLVPASYSDVAYATLPWTAPGVGTYAITATYTPSVPSFTGSTSTQTNTLVVSSAPSLVLRLPGSYFVNHPVYLTAITSSTTTQGTAAFQLNPLQPNVPNIGITGSQTLVNGATSTVWTPTQAGQAQIIAQFSNSTGTASGQMVQPINVLPDPVNDPVSVAPTGQAPWRAGVPVTIQLGQNLLLGASSGSGAPVTLAESGPCILNGALLTAVAAGTCQVTASSPGQGSYDPSTTTFTVNVVGKAKPKKKG